MGPGRTANSLPTGFGGSQQIGYAKRLGSIAFAIFRPETKHNQAPMECTQVIFTFQFEFLFLFSFDCSFLLFAMSFSSRYEKAMVALYVIRKRTRWWGNVQISYDAPRGICSYRQNTVIWGGVVDKIVI